MSELVIDLTEANAEAQRLQECGHCAFSRGVVVNVPDWHAVILHDPDCPRPTKRVLLAINGGAA